MAITNYGELKDAVERWLNRDDSVTVATIPDFIEMCRANLNRDLEEVRARDTITANAGTLAVSTDYGKLYSATLRGYGPLQTVTPQRIELEAARFTTSGVPQYACMTPGTGGGGSLRLVPVPDHTYTIDIEAQPLLAAFVADADTNDILTYHPDLYLYGSLKHAAPYLKDDERLGTWEKLYTDGVGALRLAIQRRRFPNTPIVRPRRALGE